MTDEMKLKMMEMLAKGGIRANQLILENSGTINYNDYGSDKKEATAAERDVDGAAVAEALTKCSSLVWGNAAYAVVFCMCRDLYGWQNNASMFERQMELHGIHFPAGTVNATLNRLPYMKLNVDKWDKNGALDRVLKLRDELRAQIDANTQPG